MAYEVGLRLPLAFQETTSREAILKAAQPISPSAPGRSSYPSPMPVCIEARDIVDEVLVRERVAIIELLERCESPVEQMLVAALWDMWRCRVRDSRLGMGAVLEGSPHSSPIRRVIIEPQKVITTERARYRADVMVYVTPGDDKGRGIAPGPLVVEVDGHEFHERTKFQAASDRQRDRAMIAEGFRVIRFTGQEVFRDPGKCAREVSNLLGAA